VIVVTLTENKGSEEKLLMDPVFELIPPSDNCNIG
jgi:hypothetical protein